MFEIPKIEMPSVQVRRFTVAEIKIMSDADLLKILSGEDLAHGMLPPPTQQLISAELLSRGLAKASKPHWSIVPSFALLIVSVILSIIAIALPFYLLSSSTPPVQTPIKPPIIDSAAKAPVKPVLPAKKPAVDDKTESNKKQ